MSFQRWQGGATAAVVLLSSSLPQAFRYRSYPLANDIRKPVTLVLGAALLGGIAAPAFAITDLAQGYALGASAQTPPTAEKQANTTQADDTAAKHHAEGKCGEGKCGAAKTDTANTDASKAATDNASTDNAAAADKAHAEGKCGEGKCGGKH